MRLNLWYIIDDVEYLVQLEILNFKKSYFKQNYKRRWSRC